VMDSWLGENASRLETI